MVKMKLTSGPHRGRVRDVSRVTEPLELLASCIKYGWGWKIDYSQSSDAEKFEWGRVDMSARITRALATGLPVTFLGQKYNGLQSAQAVEDAIIASNRMVTVARDDDRGVVVWRSFFLAFISFAIQIKTKESSQLYFP